MDDKRAKEIISSPVMANVTYNGNKVYMESLDEPEKCCIIHFIDQPVVRLNVPLYSLIENKS